MNKPTDPPKVGANAKNYIQVNILEVQDCFLDKSQSFKVPVDRLAELIEFIELLAKKEG